MRVSLEKISKEMPDPKPGSIPFVTSGLVDDFHYATVLMDKSGIVLAVLAEWDIRYDDYVHKWGGSIPRLEVNNPEIFGFYQDAAMEALKKIGQPERSSLIEFSAYETMGAAIGHTSALARIDF